MQTELTAESRLLRILPLRFKLRSKGMGFPEFSGSAWHGGLGMMLAKQSPHAFQRLYQTAPESRLYALLPPMQKQFAASELFELRITLFGHGTDHALAVTQAIAELGKTGIRPGGHYELIEASVIEPKRETRFISAQDGFLSVPCARAVDEYLIPEPYPIEQCHIQFTTPLRIKEGNNLLRKVPDLAQFLRRIFSRLDQLAHVAEEIPPLAKTLRIALYAQAENIEIKSSNVTPYGLERRSARSGQQMQFSGIVGAVSYVGEMQHLIPWLRLAGIAQLGGKTAFGFGGLEIKVTNAD